MNGFFYINAYFSLTNTLFLVDKIDGVEILLLVKNKSWFFYPLETLHWL